MRTKYKFKKHQKIVLKKVDFSINSTMFGFENKNTNNKFTITKKFIKFFINCQYVKLCMVNNKIMAELAQKK